MHQLARVGGFPHACGDAAACESFEAVAIEDTEQRSFRANEAQGLHLPERAVRGLSRDARHLGDCGLREWNARTGCEWTWLTQLLGEIQDGTGDSSGRRAFGLDGEPAEQFCMLMRDFCPNRRRERRMREQDALEAGLWHACDARWHQCREDDPSREGRSDSDWRNARTVAEHFERDSSAVLTVTLDREGAVDDHLKRICGAGGGGKCGTSSQFPLYHVRVLQHLQA